MDLPQDMKEAMVRAANHSLAKATWSTYKTVGRHIENCQEETGRRFTFPMSQSDIMLLSSWLLIKREVRGATVEAYLSAVRQIHLAKGLTPPDVRPEIVKTVLKGARHMDTIDDRVTGRRSRLPVTVEMLKIIKLELADMEIPFSMKRLVWMICSINFFGCLRVHETLARSETEFDPCFTLLGKDVELKSVNCEGEEVEILQLKLKSPKEDRIGSSVFIDIYETKGLLCPVKAYKKWKGTKPPTDKNMPAFRQENGIPLTGRKLNEILKTCLDPHVPYQAGFVTSHSFRSGMASLMATLGYTTEQVKAVGRWSSNAYERYIKLPRKQRADMAKDIGNWRI